MAGKKIGLVLALDGEQQYTQALQNAKKETNLLKTEMKNLSQEFDGNANSIEALHAKQENLTKQQDAYQRKLAAAKTGLENAKKAYNQQADALEELKKKLSDAEEAQKKMEDAGDNSSDAYKEQCKQVKELSDAVEKQTTNTLKASGRVTDWNQKVSESEGELKKVNKALDQNEQYLKEAESATDKCAYSIDNFGKEVKDTADNLDDANQKSSIFGDVLKASLTGTAIVEGIKKVGEAAKEVGKYVIDVGSSFEAAMSEVEAISGATGDQVSQMAEKAKEFGSSTKFSATEVANAFKYMSLAGWSTSDMLSSIDGVLNLAAASGMDLASASDMVTDYLSAFSMEASDAAYMADMLAYAQANSNTTATQLGEAYGNCAANLNAAGQDIETVTSILEGFANQGVKGSEAGTKLSAIMRDITANMKDGKIAIGDTNIEVADANGNYRDLTDILSDVEKATNGLGDAEKATALSATFTSRSVGGLNMILNEGLDKISGYEQELRNANGAASDMSATINDNLKGDLVEAGSALEGLGIAAYDYIDGPVRGVVQGVTGIIQGITEAITPQKSELESFIDDIKNSNDEVQRTLDSAQSVMDGATADVAELEAYKQVLMDLNEQESLTEFQKYQLANAVNALSDSVPGLSESFDAANGTLSITNEELENLFNNAEAVAMQTALIDAQKSSYDALAQATINKAKADSAAKTAQEELDIATSEYQKRIEETGTETNDYYSTYLDAQLALDDATKAQKEANKVHEEASKQIEEEDNALADLKEQYGLIPDATSEAADGVSSVGKAVEETGRVFDEYGNDITGMSEEQANAVTEASKKIVDAYSDMRDGIEDSIKGSMSLFDEFSGGEAISAETINTNLESQIQGITQWSENMKTLAGQIGQGFSQELYDELAAMGPEQSATAVQALVEALNSESGEFEQVSKNWSELLSLQDNADAIAQATSAGKDLMGGVATGITDGSEEVTTATQQATQAAVEAAQEEAQSFRQVGTDASQTYVEGLRSAVSQSAQAAGNIASAARSALASYQNAFQNTGYNMSAGVASGIRSGQSLAINAAINMAKQALAAAKREADIHSPSGKFRREFGQQISAGAAFGISDKASLAGKAASKMSAKVYTNATAWLAKYKQSQQVSIEDEKAYWQEVIKHTKSGTTAYNNVLKKIQAISIAELSAAGLSSSVASSVVKNFGVSKTTGSGKSKKTKDAETYYSEVYSAAEKYLSNQQVLNDWSLQQELAYWEAVRGQLKSGTQAWYDATKQINSLQEDITQAAEDARKTQASVQKDILDKYKVYYKVSAKAEADYWNAARKQFAAGTAERIEADQKYMEALQDWYDQRKKLDEDYAESSKDINDQLADSVKELQDAYHDAVQSRKEDILSSMDLFESWDASGYDADTLLYNLKTQVSGLALWEQQLEELGKKNLSAGLLEELKAMGPDAAANIYSLNQMTAEQLDEYNKLWEQKNALALSQAVKDNEQLRNETNSEIAKLRTEAQAELNMLNADYRAALQELNAGMASDLATLVGKAGSIGEDAVSGLIAGIGKAANSVDTYNSTTQVVTQVSGQLSALEPEGEAIGKNTLDGLLAGMMDDQKIRNSAQSVVRAIKDAMEEEAEINSPSKLFRRETGPQIPAGVALGMEDNTKAAIRSAKEMVHDTLSAAQEEMAKQQQAMQSEASLLDFSGIARLNRMTERYRNPAPVVNIDNSTLASLLATLISAVNEMPEKIGSLRAVISPDDAVETLQPLMDKANGDAAILMNRGRY